MAMGGVLQHLLISIHALREEGDAVRNSPQLPSAHISIHALREEGDEAAASIQKDGVLFLSTPSARRATDLMKSLCLRLIYFYPRPP